MKEKGINITKYREDFYPISVYSRFTGKDLTKILAYDGNAGITYLCLETNKEDVVDFKKEHIVKLNWKVDWPMRWKYEQVHFEPGGSDHAAPGGSYDVSSIIARDIFKIEPPVFVEYMFVGIRGLGSKMSGSKGNAVTPLDLLDIYDPAILKWLYSRKDPNQSFQLAFDSEIYRQYDEFDKAHDNKMISFRQLVGLGQIVQWQQDRLITILKELKLDYDEHLISQRLPLAKNWLVKYNHNEFIKLREEVNEEYARTLSVEQKNMIKRFYNELLSKKEASIEDLEFLTYAIPKDSNLSELELKKAQRAFFKDVYNLLIGKDTGPRLGTFLWAVDRSKVLKLLNIK